MDEEEKVPMKEEEATLQDEELPEEIPEELPPEGMPPAEEPVEGAEEPPAEEFDAQAAYEELKGSVESLSEQLSMLKEAWDKLEEGENEDGKEGPAPPEEALPPEEAEFEEDEEKAPPKKPEEEKEAKHSKDLAEMEGRIYKKLEAKFSRQGVKKTMPSSKAKREDAISELAKADLKRHGYMR